MDTVTPGGAARASWNNLIKQTNNKNVTPGEMLSHQTLQRDLNKDLYSPGVLFALYFLCGSSLGSFEGIDCGKTIRGKYFTCVKNRQKEMDC